MRISDWNSDVCSSDLAVTDEVAFVVRQLDDPHAEQVEQIEPSDLGTDRHAVLETEDNAKPSTGLRRAQVRTGTDLHQMIGQRLNETLIAGDPSQAFLEPARRITRGAARLVDGRQSLGPIGS